MMPTEIPSYIFAILKVLSLVGLTIYAIFAAVLVRQEQLMAHVLEESFEPILRIVVIAHAVAAIGLLMLTAVIL